MRNATLEDLAGLLKEQHARKVDVVVPAGAIRAKGAQIQVQGSEVEMTLEGVTSKTGTYLPTEVFDEGLAAKLGVPGAYLKHCRLDGAEDLYDANVNGWLHGRTVRRVGQEPEVVREADKRSFLFRGFEGGEGKSAVARALLSDQFSLVDNLDVLTAALTGIKAAGVHAHVDSCDLTDRRMYMRVVVPELKALAPELLKGYRSPFADRDVNEARNHGWDLERGLEAARNEGLDYGGDEPIVFAGLDIRNSEVGNGAFSIAPVLVVKVCRNGLVITEETYRKVHVGAKMDQGRITWSQDTQRKNLDLIVAQTRDSVQEFLSAGFVERSVRKIEEKAGAPVTEVEATVKRVTKTLKFSEAETNGVLDHFIRGGQMTAGGVVNAITSYSQTVASADRSHDLDDAALRALDLLAR
jgi:hypothetical protein